MPILVAIQMLLIMPMLVAMKMLFFVHNTNACCYANNNASACCYANAIMTVGMQFNMLYGALISGLKRERERERES